MKKNIIDNMYKLSCHRGINVLYNLILEQDFFWYNIFSNFKNYISNCFVYQELHKNNYKKPHIKQIITNSPKEKYAVYFIDIDIEIDDFYQRYKFILNIIDHFVRA